MSLQPLASIDGRYSRWAQITGPIKTASESIQSGGRGLVPLMAAILLIYTTVTFDPARAAALGGTVPPTAAINDYLVIGTKPFTADHAVNISQNELGGDRSVITSDNDFVQTGLAPTIIEAQNTNVFPLICYEAGSPMDGCEANPQDGSSSKASRALIPDIHSVFQANPSDPFDLSSNSWVPGDPLVGFDDASDATSTNPALPGSPGVDYLPYTGTGSCPTGALQARTFRGVDWSGNIAVTSPSGIFALSNVNLFANYGVRSTSAVAGDNISGSYYYAAGSLNGLWMDSMDIGGGGADGPNPALGWTGNYDHGPLVADLRAWRDYLRAQTPEFIYSSNIENESTIKGAPAPRVDCFDDSLDVNGDGIITVDIKSPDVNNFFVNNSDWVIDGSGNKLIVFRLRDGRNMQVSNSSIMIGAGLADGGTNYSKLGVIFAHVHPDEEFTSDSGSSDTVFTLGQSIMNGIGLWDLNTINDAATDTDYGGYVDRAKQGNYTNISHNNTQGCGQFISPRVNMQNVRWVHCLLGVSAAPSDYGDLPDDNSLAGSPTSPGYDTDADGIVGPSHTIVDGLVMGAVVDAETGGLPDATATGDDLDDVVNDDDGVTLPANFWAGDSSTVTVTVTNTSATDATLCGYIDFNADGVFDPVTELSSVLVPAGTATSAQDLVFAVPPNAVTSTDVGARFRLGTLACAPDGPGGDGEVEDYLVRIDSFDLALALVASPTTVSFVGDVVTWTIRVQNQGTVASGLFDVTNTLPTGTEFVSASDGGIWSAERINWNNLASLEPGEFRDFTVVTEISDVGVSSFRSWAEISVAAGPDADSTPDTDTGSDQTLPNDASVTGGGYVSITDLAVIAVNDSPLGDEDDNDDAEVLLVAPVEYSLGNRIWLDDGGTTGTANNGVLDGDEVGIDAVGVSLYDADPITGAPVGTALAREITTSGGYYRFDGLYAGDYVVVVDSSNFLSGAALDGYVSSTGVTAWAGQLDTDGLDHGVDTTLDAASVDPGGVSSEPITLGVDLQPLLEADVPDPDPTGESVDADSNRTVDFGFYQPYDLSIAMTVVSPEPIAANSLVVYELTVTNEGPGSEDVGWSITNLLPAGLSYDTVAASGVDFTCDPPNAGEITCTSSAPLAPGESVVLQVSALVDSSVAPATELTSVGYVSPAPTSPDELIVLEIPTLTTDVAASLTNNDDSATIVTAPPAASIGNYVWIDSDNDGTQNETPEQGVNGVVVSLTNLDGSPALDLDGVVVPDQITANDVNGNPGYYLFGNLSGGTYVVTFSDFPVGYEPTVTDAGPDDLDSDGASVTVTAVDETTDVTIDFGLFAPASVGDLVWEDLDADGIQDLGEPGLAGATVTLVDDAGVPVAADVDGNPIAPIVTGSDGRYLFANLLPGSYAVEVVLPDGYYPSPVDAGDDALDSDGLATPPVAVGPNELVPTLDVGAYQPVSVGDYVWVDRDRDGFQDSTEVGIPGVTAALTDLFGNSVTDVDGNAVGPVTTDEFGQYLFTGLLPDAYRVVFSGIPSPYEITVTNAEGVADLEDSDGLVATSATIPSGGSDLTLDLGLFAPVSVGDLVWEDVDLDGMQGATEPPMAGVTVTLFDADGAPVVVDAYGADVSPVVTSVDGSYLFDDLLPGQYQVSFEAPAGVTPTTADQGADDAIDSDAPVATSVLLDPGEADLSLDGGFVLPVSVGNYVWLDSSNDGLQNEWSSNGINGVTVTLLDSGGEPVLVDASGDPVTSQVTGDNLLGEPGYYLFENLLPGVYQVAFSNLPAGHVATATDQGTDDTVDSDGLTATSSVIQSGDSDLTLDLGLFAAASIGDLVWEDLNADGIQDPGEPGMAGAVVTLLDTDGQPAVDADGVVIAPQITDLTGAYLFENLVPGLYEVVFEPPAGAYLTSPNVGADDAVDSDGPAAVVSIGSGQFEQRIDAGIFYPASLGDYVWVEVSQDGVQQADEPPVAGVVVTLLAADGTPVTVDAAGNVLTPTATDGAGWYEFNTLVPGEYMVAFSSIPDGHSPAPMNVGTDDAVDSDGLTTHITTLMSGEHDPTLDLGLIASASIGNLVWMDLNNDGLQDADEPGMPGVTVTVVDASGTPVTVGSEGALITSQTTGADGYYSFGNLAPGDYAIEFSDLPDGFVPSPSDQGVDDMVDSDGLVTALVAVGPGSSDDSLDLGLFSPVSVGDYVWFDLNRDGLQNEDAEFGVNGIGVTLLDGDGVPVVVDAYGDPVVQIVTADNVDGNPGYYLFENLLPGGYTVEFSSLPTGAEPTAGDQGADDAVDSDGLSATSADLALGQHDPTLDLGLFAPVAVGDLVWEDLDGDGIQDAGEPPLSGATLTVLDDVGNPVPKDAYGTIVYPITTDIDGLYTFDSLLPGTYQVGANPPPGFVASPSDVGTDDTVDSDGPVATSTPLGMFAEDLSLDFGFFTPVTTGGFVWNDLNGDGIQDPGEPGIVGALVTLTTVDGNPVVATDGSEVVPVTTGDDGNYEFSSLPPGQYMVTFVAPDGYVSTVSLVGDPTLDSNGIVTTSALLISGEADTTLDSGFYLPAAIGNLVWSDVNGDGIQGSDEPGVAGVNVALTSGDGDPLGPETVTDATGFYLFADLAPGTYSVAFSNLPSGALVTATDQGGDDVVDSDGLFPDPVLVVSGEENLSLDLGVAIAGIVLNNYVTTEALSVPLDPSDPATWGCDAQSLPEDGSRPDPCQIADWGGTVVHRIVVTNDGQLPLTDLTFSQSVTDADQVCTDWRRIEPTGSETVLGVGESWFYQCEVHDVAGRFTHEATVSALAAGADGLARTDATPVTSTDIAVMDPAHLVVEMDVNKTLIESPAIGSDAVWHVDVVNLGPDPAWGPVTIVDDLPTGLAGAGASGTGWSCDTTGPDDRRMICTYPETIQLGESHTIEIRGRVIGEIPSLASNEVYLAHPILGNPILAPSNSGTGPFADGLESYPSADSSLVNPYIEYTVSDTASNVLVDEAPIGLFDLALQVEYLSDSTGETSDGTVGAGDQVTFNITAINQGTLDAEDVGLAVYVPPGLTLSDTGWTMNGSIAMLITPFDLAAGQVNEVTITFNAASVTEQQTLDVFAEITSASNASGTPDYDSTPDSDNGNDLFVTDDDVTGAGKATPATDEDDHDLAQVVLIPTASTSSSSTPPSSTSPLAFTGASTTLYVTVGLVFVLTGLALLGVGGTRRRFRAPR